MYYEWDWPAAEREFRRALALDPSYATGHEWYGLFLAAMGRFDEAVAEERLAQELDPLSTAVAATSAWVSYYGGHLDAADRELRVVLRQDPTLAIAHLYLGRVREAIGDVDGALGEYDATGALRRWVPTVAARGWALAMAGRERDALASLAVMDSMSHDRYVTAYAVALVYAKLGRTDSAYAWLDRAVEERTHWLVWLNRDPRWDPIRGDARFASVVKRVGLPP
jgi:tetratricopeptide (TPR) repeat protein